MIKQFYKAGCRNLQLDDCTWGAIVGDAAKQRYKALGIDLEDVKKQLLTVNNLALEGRPEDMVITSHICRGNYHSTFFTSGPYDTVAYLQKKMLMHFSLNMMMKDLEDLHHLRKYQKTRKLSLV